MQKNAARITAAGLPIMAPKLYRTCKRYLKKEEDIEEVLADSFCTIFSKIEQLKELGLLKPGQGRLRSIIACFI